MSTRYTTVAFIYDFDGTLVPGSMQEHAFIPDCGYSKKRFWKEVKQLSSENDMDEISAYMLKMCIASADGRQRLLSKKVLRDYGKGLKFFDGVLTWFSRINKLARKRKIKVEHYIVSSGIKEMIEGSKIGRRFKRIFASNFYYPKDRDVAAWPANVVNYTTKTQYLFRINKGCLSMADSKAVNQFMKPEDRAIPFENMVYFGDGDTDVPCLKVVTQNGGNGVVVYKPRVKGAKEKAQRIVGDRRARFIAPADYRRGRDLHQIAEAIIEAAASRAKLDKHSN
jgi:hypothetical protein